MSFQSKIVEWYHQHKRDLPWRNTTDAYTIWLSEIILQQTRVEQGLPYFNRFLAQYPTVGHFASASETEVLKLWQGLGYYSRGRNMLKTAVQVHQEYGGKFPVSYAELIRLKGIGDYTAAAISSFSSGEARAVVDGNVFRVLSRYFGIHTPINSTRGKQEFTALAASLLQGQQPAVYNQAIMEFGALWCRPRSPRCAGCPVAEGCFARQHKVTESLPVKERKLKKRTRYFNYFFCVNPETKEILVKRRMPGDIWQELYDFPLLETEGSPEQGDAAFSNALKAHFGEDYRMMLLSHRKHLLTHQTIYIQFFALDNYIVNFNQHANIKWVSLNDFEALPQPKVIADFIKAYT
ncbi:A/G-specific adenine glycosylase [Pedobacter sp. JY14-1]|uniref:A/G-specific adenine glycosylase n=1 Tax=Pedobacter sp. JY14-1 TaxID=3034151 RepID=UPI0023E34A20|nr:A/G-specific adenine glycosylase [Pedobacter sp. JY14-1]